MYFVKKHCKKSIKHFEICATCLSGLKFIFLATVCIELRNMVTYNSFWIVSKIFCGMLEDLN